MNDLFDPIEPRDPPREVMADGAMLLRGSALPFEADILSALQAMVGQAPFRHMTTPGRSGDVGGDDQLRRRRLDHGPLRLSIRPHRFRKRSAVASDPDCFLELAIAAAAEAGYPQFVPDACLMIAMSLAPVCRCIRTRTSAISRIRSCRCPGPAGHLPVRWPEAQRSRREVLRTTLTGDIRVRGGRSRLCYHGFRS